MKFSNNTNVWDVMVTALYLSYLLAAFGGTAYMVQVYDWSAWWFVLTVMVLAGVRIRTGSFN